MAKITYFGHHSFLELKCTPESFEVHRLQLLKSLEENDYYVSTMRKISIHIIELIKKRKLCKVFLTCGSTSIYGRIKDIKPYNVKNKYEANCLIILDDPNMSLSPNVMEF